MRALAAIMLVVAALGACTSPEATRQRAGGPGGDIGNRRDFVELHEGSEPYWRTPRALSGPRGTPVAASPVSR